MQSGISASADLHAAFAAFRDTPTTRALLATISAPPEALVPLRTVPASSPAAPLAADLPAVAAALAPDAAAYVLLRDGPRVLAATYVPDAASTRSKMLFASSRLTLVRELGSEHFAGTLFATSREDFSVEGWERAQAHEGAGAGAVLSAQERDLEGIKAAEAAESTGTSTRRGGHVVAGGVSMPAADDAVAALKELASGNGGAVQLNIVLPKETISLVSTHSASEATPKTLQTLISSSQPRYTFYKHPANGTFLFLYTCPAGCSVKERMVYAASMRSIPVVAQQEAGLDASKKIEASGPDEITEASVLDEVEPQAQVKPSMGASSGGFARPKRPGRR